MSINERVGVGGLQSPFKNTKEIKVDIIERGWHRIVTEWLLYCTCHSFNRFN